jgi:myo-inositol 2-dehydrogenase/D-chiro-inositol 1-dehydrogenase
MGLTHARALEVSDAVEITCVVEPSDDAASRVAVPRVSIDELSDVDGALVAVPTRYHLEVVTRLAEYGFPILCEKPCGLTSDETRQIAALDAPLQVAYWRRFVPALRQLRERIQAGALGDLVFVSCGQWDEYPPPAAFREPRSSGGIVVDMGVHELDQLRWLTGREIIRAAGVSGGVSWDETVEDDPELADVVLELDGGVAATVTLGRRHPSGEFVRIEVVGLNDDVMLDFVAPPDGEQTIAAALRAQAEDFAARGGRGATVADAVAALEAAERVKEALGLP